MSHKTVEQALQYVADHPDITRPPIDTPVWELVARTIYGIANSPDKRVRGSMGRAHAAQKILLDRMVGRRRPGTAPVQTGGAEVTFVDLTVGVLPDADYKQED